MDTVSYNLGRAVAPPLTVAIVVVTHGYGSAFAANAVTFLVFTLMLILAGKGADAEPERRSRVKDGFVIARRSARIMLLLLMVAAVTIADDPVQVLGPALANHLGVSQGWSGWFIAALGAGSVAWVVAPLTALAVAPTGGDRPRGPRRVHGCLRLDTVGLGELRRRTCRRGQLPARELHDADAAVSDGRHQPGERDGGLGDRLGRKQTAGVDHRRAACGWIGVRPTGMILAIPAFLPIVALAARAWQSKRSRRRTTSAPAPVAPSPVAPAPVTPAPVALSPVAPEHGRGSANGQCAVLRRVAGRRPVAGGTARPAACSAGDGPAEPVGGDVVCLPRARDVTAVTAESITAIELDTRQQAQLIIRFGKDGLPT